MCCRTRSHRTLFTTPPADSFDGEEKGSLPPPQKPISAVGLCSLTVAADPRSYVTSSPLTQLLCDVIAADPPLLCDVIAADPGFSVTSSPLTPAPM